MDEHKEELTGVDQVEIDPISDEDLESVSGGCTSNSCSTSGCSNSDISRDASELT